ncbi:MAG: dihydrolipoyl dehydrogenase [Burkholderiales bacterium]|jgi:dihydrolipoamide dehydrogenase|nr:dihydrolipoyl dehydrogenase [Burkholderiales bacterium]
MSDVFDVVVIGAGPGGYIAAIRAAQLGFSVACIDQAARRDGKPAPGGTCTNVGCIPSKALLQSSEHFDMARRHLSEHGIAIKSVAIDIPAMIGRKDKIVGQTNDGILYLFKKNKIRFYQGRGAFSTRDGNRWTLTVAPTGIAKETATLSAQHVIVATGSSPRALPNAPFDNQYVLDNEGALAMQSVPKRFGIVGAGVIGLEMGSLWQRLGAEVTLLEALPDFLSVADDAVAKEAAKQFKAQGLTIHTGINIEEVKTNDKEVKVHYRDSKGAEQNVVFDKLVVSIGRVPNTQGLNAEAVGLKLDERGAIEVDDCCRANLPNVWAIGDVVRGPMLAHKAEEEGNAVAERIAGQKPHVDFNTIPYVIYTSPEIAWVGKNEQQLKAEGADYRSGRFPFMANGRARAMGDTRGFVKWLADAQTDCVLGLHIIGPCASELIMEGVIAIEFGASSEDIARICHAHPTLAEAVKEAALAIDGRTLNL